MASLMWISLMLITTFLRLITKLRLGIPLLYTILMITVSSGWAAKYEAASIGILIGLLLLVGFSWLVTLIRKLRSVI